MKHWAKNLALELVQTIQLNQRRHDESPSPSFLCLVQCNLINRTTLFAHRFNMPLNTGLSLSINHRPDVYAQPLRVAHAIFSHRTFKHLDHSVGAISLQTQDSQRRATLTSAIKRRGDDVYHYLLSEGR
ncbi:hypothetical protein D3C81_1390080 [compost metagenome]